MIKVSVIVPVYNREKFLATCLDSLIGQTLQDIEIIIVDNNSTDDSIKIARSYAKRSPKKIKLLHCKKQGVSAARNLGIREATGEYLAFVDSDDYVDVTMYEKMYKTAKTEKADLVWCGYATVNKDGVIIEEPQAFVTNKNRKKEYIANSVAAWDKIFKRQIFLQNNLEFSTEIKTGEDLALIPTIILYCQKVAHLSDQLYYYRSGQASLSSGRGNINDTITALKIMQDAFDRANATIQYREEIEWRYIQNLVINIGLKSYNHNYQREQVAKTIKEVMSQRFPKWQKNKYYSQLSFSCKLRTKLLYHGMFPAVSLIVKIKNKGAKHEN